MKEKSKVKRLSPAGDSLFFVVRKLSSASASRPPVQQARAGDRQRNDRLPIGMDEREIASADVSANRLLIHDGQAGIRRP